DGAFTYLPDPGFIGSDSFTYKVTDGFLESNVATVKLLVANPPQIRRLTLVGTGASQVHRSNVKWIEVEFENFPLGIDPDAPGFVLEQRDSAGNWAVAPVELRVHQDVSRVVRISFAYAGTDLDSLPDGQYRLTLLSSNMRGWYRLLLDANYDGVPG